MARRPLAQFLPAALSALPLLLAACAPLAHLSFPVSPVSDPPGETWYDVNRNGKADFGLHYDSHGRVNSLIYQDVKHENVKREQIPLFTSSRFTFHDPPHLILLLDSIPYQMAADRYAAGHFRFLDPPIKVIPPFPTLTEICYTRVLHAPPLPGVTDVYFDRSANKIQDHALTRMESEEPWERRLRYHASFLDGGLTYTNPRAWLDAELERAREAFDKSPDHTTAVYVISASGMACKYGAEGINEVLDKAERLCLQVLYERRGNVRITVMADHGHNLTESKNVPLTPALKAAGFHPARSIETDRDVVIELCALVNYIGLHTRQPQAVADAMLNLNQVEFATYVSNGSVIVRDRDSAAAIECRDTRLSYRPITGDPLRYSVVLKQLMRDGKATADGYVADSDWLAATADHQYPDAPRRLWDAFHGEVVNTPDLMLTLHDGYYCGLSSLERFIHMASTHGALNQQNSATFLMTMRPHTVAKTIRSDQVLSVVEPGLELPAMRDSATASSAAKE